MRIQKLIVKNYKLLKDIVINLNPEINIFVGDNDAGKSSILEVLSILTSGKLNGISFERQLKANLFNCETRKDYISRIVSGEKPEPPRIILEAYFDGDSRYRGSENEFATDAIGIRAVVGIIESNSDTYKKMLQSNEIKDIPIELYGVTYNYFSGDTVSFRFSPFKSVFIDTSRKDYAGLVDHFVSESITDNLTEEDVTNLAVAYKASRRQFHENDVILRLNDAVKATDVLKGREVSIDLREEDIDAWKKQMSIVVDNTPYENIGFGTQNLIKIELAMRNAKEQANVVLMEEPENNLAFSNLTQLIKKVIDSEGKQIFISTHSSYITNKLNLGNTILVKKGILCSYQSLSDGTKKYFTKLSGYDTLRFVLATRVILVEGPTDDLIIQRAYYDRFGRFPSDDGIDILAVESLAFKRFADIANLIGKDVAIVTDNDGDIEENIKRKYEKYLDKTNLHFFYSKDEALNTIEPCVLSSNCVEGIPSDTFKSVISKNGSLESRDYQGILKFMSSNKTEWALRVFEAEDDINYPQYIKDVVEFFA